MSGGARGEAGSRLDVAEAVAAVMDALGRVREVEDVPLLDALDRVLAEDAVAPLTLPPWDNAGMDGYAVRAEEVRGARADAPVALPVVATVAAGGEPPPALCAGEAMRIMTGAPLPRGADTVIRVEDTDAGETRVLVRDARDAGRNVRPRGEDLRAGDLALAAGTALGPAQLALLAACGVATPRVVRRPRVAILGSGDELVELDLWGEALAGRRIVSSNSYALHALVRQAGGVPVPLGIARDDPGDLRRRLAGAGGCDLLLTSAGISVGAFDHTRDVLDAMGAELRFWRARIRPGGPVGFGVLPDPADGTRTIPWLGLPGNPVSAQVTFELFGRPAIRRLGGHRLLFRRPVPVVLEEDVTIAAPLTHFQRAVVAARADGMLGARLTGPQGSGLLTSMARANALLVIPADAPRSERGSTRHALLLDEPPLAERFAL